MKVTTVRENILNFLGKNLCKLLLAMPVYVTEEVIRIELGDRLYSANFAKVMQQPVRQLLYNQFATII